jgi:hypothetical protein
MSMRTVAIVLSILIQCIIINSTKAQWTDTRGPAGGGGLIAFQGKHVFVWNYHGIYRSSDDGVTWKCISRDLDASFGSVVVYDSLLFASNSHALYESKDSGSSWESISPGVYGSIFITPWGRMFATLWPNHLVWSDDGKNWNDINDTTVTNLIQSYPIRFKSISKGIFAVVGNQAFQSIDSGLHWIRCDSLKNYGYIQAIDAIDSVLYIVQHRTVYASTNAGKEWVVKNSYVGKWNNDYVLCLKAVGSALFMGMNSGIYGSLDSGKDWQELTGNLGDTKIGFIGENGSSLFISGQKGLYVSNGPTSWKYFGINAGETPVKSMTFEDGRLIYATTSHIFESTNNGDSWYSINTDSIKYDIQSLVVSGQDFYVGTIDGVYHSSDFGRSWKTGLSFGWTTALAVSGQNLYAGWRKFYRSTNNGLTWSSINTPFDTITAIVVRGDTLYVTTYKNSIFISTDAGVTWSHKELKNPYTETITLIGSNIIVATSNSINVSTDRGTTWRQTLSNITVSSFAKSGDLIFASGGLEQLYYSTNYGIAWKKVVSNGLQPWGLVAANDTFVFVTAGNVSGGGVIRRRISEIVGVRTVNHVFSLDPSLAIYPNPAFTSTNIIYNIPEPGFIEIKISDILGREVDTLYSGLSEAGLHSLSWNLAKIPFGIYHCNFQFQGKSMPLTIIHH